MNSENTIPTENFDGKKEPQHALFFCFALSFVPLLFNYLFVCMYRLIIIYPSRRTVQCCAKYLIEKNQEGGKMITLERGR